MVNTAVVACLLFFSAYAVADTVIAWDDERIVLIGRYLASDSFGQCDWSNTGFSVSSLTASSVSLLLSDHGNYYNIYLGVVVLFF